MVDYLSQNHSGISDYGLELFEEALKTIRGEEKVTETITKKLKKND